MVVVGYCDWLFFGYLVVGFFYVILVLVGNVLLDGVGCVFDGGRGLFYCVIIVSLGDGFMCV